MRSRIRKQHRYASAPALWLGDRNRGPLNGASLYTGLDLRKNY